MKLIYKQIGRNLLLLLLLGMTYGLQAQIQFGYSKALYPVSATTDENGNHYVATVFDIQIFDPHGVLLRKINIPRMGGNALDVRRVQIDSDGAVYVLETGNRKVIVFGANGDLLLSFGTTGNQPGQFSFPSDLVLDAAGNIYVVDEVRKVVSVFTKTGVFVKQLGVGHLSAARYLAVDGSGKVYVADPTNRVVKVIDGNNNLLLTVGSAGTNPGQFQSAIEGVTVDAIGRIYVCESWISKISIFESNGSYVTSLQSGATIIDFNNKVFSLTVRNKFVSILSSDLVESKKIGGSDIYSQPGNLYQHTSLAFDSDNNIYVADAGNGRVQVFNAQGEFVRAFGSFGAANNQFIFLRSIALDRNDQVYILDSDKVKVFSKNGDFIRTFGTSGSGAGQFSQARGIKVDVNGRIYVADTQNNRVQIFSNEGNFIRSIAFDGNKYVFSVETFAVDVFYLGVERSSIFEYSNDGTNSSLFSNPGTPESAMGFPVAIAATDDFVYVRDQKYVHKYDKVSRSFVSRLGKSGINPGEIADDIYSGYATMAISRDHTLMAVGDMLRVQIFPLVNNITFESLSQRTLSDGNFTLTATASSNLPVSFESSNPDVASIDGNLVTVKKTGTVTITAKQEGNGITPAAQQVVRDLVISKRVQSITFEELSLRTFGDAPFELEATSTSGLPVSFTSSNTAVATVENNMVTIVGAGTVTITASQQGDNIFKVAPPIEQVLTVNKASQTITFPILAAKTFGDSPFSPEVNASSGFPVVLSSSDETIASVVNNTITIHKAGDVLIMAVQVGNQNYLEAVPVEQRLFIGKALQEIAFADIPDQRMEDNTFQLSATSTSGLSVTYIGSHPEVASISGNMVTFHKPGTIAIAANQAGNENYEAAIQVARLLTILKEKQTIAFGPLADRVVGEEPFELIATSDRNLPITYVSSDENVATVQGNMVTLRGAGTTVITARQDGNESVDAMETEQPLVVRLVTEVENPASELVTIYPNPASDKIVLVPKKDVENILITVLDATGREVTLTLTKKERGVFEANIISLPNGLYTIRIQTQEALHSIKFVKE